MSIGTSELLLFVLISVAAFFAALFSGRKWPWTAGIAACFGLAMVVTPADPASMLLAATPLLLMLWGIKTLGPTTRSY